MLFLFDCHVSRCSPAIPGKASRRQPRGSLLSCYQLGVAACELPR